MDRDDVFEHGLLGDDAASDAIDARLPGRELRRRARDDEAAIRRSRRGRQPEGLELRDRCEAQLVAAIEDAVDGERVHGAVERHYRLRRERATIDADAAVSMSLEDHRHGFTAAMAALHAEFNAYLDRDHADPTADSVGYIQVPLWLSQGELAELIAEVRTAIVSRMDNKPTAHRSLHLLSPILFPIEERPQRDRDSSPGSSE